MTSISDAAATNDASPVGALRASGVALRWLVAGGYVALALSGAVSVDAGPFVASCLLLCLYIGALTAHGLRRRPSRWFPVAIPHLDAMAISSVIVATGDAQSPAWAFYLVAIAASARVSTPRATALHAASCCLGYLLAAFAVQTLDGDMAWGYAAVVCAAIVLAGISAGMTSDVEERLRHLVAGATSTDPLTGLPNRHGFHATYVASIEEAIGRRMPMALMLIDVDNFKQFNDRDGHAAGDAMLQDVAHLLEASLRRGDLVARYGGDEFVVIAPYTTRADARALAERLRAGAGGIGTSLSIGVALFPEDAAHADALLDAAEGALHRAKQAGSNCVRTAQAA